MKKLITLLLSCIMILSLAACGGTDSGESTPAAPVQSSEEAQGQVEPSSDAEVQLPDMDGYKFVMADWWSDAVPVDKEAASAWDQLQKDYHADLMDKMNFTFEQIGLQNQGDYESVIVSNFVNNAPQCSAFQVKISQFVPLAAQGLLADFSKYVDLSDDLWNRKISDYFTINGICYASRPDYDEPRLGVLFNKRLFEDAGVDPDLPYQLQRDGLWDWAHFEELCAKLTRDLDNDNKTDIYALNANDCDLMITGIYGNGAVFVDRDKDGRFIDGTTDPAFREGLEWAVSLVEKGYINEFGHGEAWDKAYTDFANGQCAMMISQTWIIQSYLTNMQDEFGYVMLPKGTSEKAHICTNMNPTPIAIPQCLSEEDKVKAGQIVSEWYDTMDNIPEAAMMGITFRDNYYNTFRDLESVDETISIMLTDEACQIYDSYQLIPNYEYYGYLVQVAARTATAAEKIEELRPLNQAAIDAANVLFGY